MDKRTKIMFGTSLLMLMMFVGTSSAAAADFVGVAVDDEYTWEWELSSDGESLSYDVTYVVTAISEDLGDYVNITVDITYDLGSLTDLYEDEEDSSTLCYNDQDIVDIVAGVVSPFIGIDMEKSYDDGAIEYNEDGVLISAEYITEDLTWTVKLKGGIPAFPTEIVSLVSIAAVAFLIAKKRK